MQVKTTRASAAQHQQVYRACWELESIAGFAGRVPCADIPHMVRDAAAYMQVPELAGITHKPRLQRSCYDPYARSIVLAECIPTYATADTASAVVLWHEFAHYVHHMRVGNPIARQYWHAARYAGIYTALLAQFMPAYASKWRERCAIHKIRGV